VIDAHAVIRGKRWRVRTAALRTNRGECDPPNKPHKEIRIAAEMHGEERLEVLIHEMLHAAYWDLDESAIEGAAADVARVLWRLGYRSPADC